MKRVRCKYCPDEHDCVGRPIPLTMTEKVFLISGVVAFVCLLIAGWMHR